MPESEFILRPYVLEDRPFIDSSWASSYYSACHIKDLLSPTDFHNFHREIRERFFKRPMGTVIVACDQDDPFHILAWIALEVLPNCTLLHYVYVKSAYRKEHGVFRDLLTKTIPKGDVVYTHMTHKFSRILARHPDLFQNFRFCPHLT